MLQRVGRQLMDAKRQRLDRAVLQIGRRSVENNARLVRLDPLRRQLRPAEFADLNLRAVAPGEESLDARERAEPIIEPFAEILERAAALPYLCCEDRKSTRLNSS